MGTTKQAENSAVKGKGIGVNGTAASDTETESGNANPTAEENPGENGVGGNNGTNLESIVNTSCGFKSQFL